MAGCKIRNEAPQRIMPGITLTSRDENNAVLRQAPTAILMPPCLMRVTALWIPGSAALRLVTVLSSDLLLVEPAESERAQPDQSEYRTAGRAAHCQPERSAALPTVFVPGIPEDVVLITNLKNLSVLPERPCVALSGKSRTTTAWRLTSPAMMTMSLKSTA